MYTQLQSYGQQNAAPTTTGANPMVWNGRQWVPQQVPPAQQLPSLSTTSIPPNPVATFTRYYHGWARKATELQQLLQQGRLSQQQQAVQQRQLEWFQYYRDNASRAAHFFSENPYATSAPQIDLPGDPDQWSPAQQQQQYQQQQQQGTVQSMYGQPQLQSTAQYSHHVPQPQPQHPPQQPQTQSLAHQDSFKRYFDRCMSQCTTPTQKLVMKKQLEQKVTMLMNDGTFHSMQWDQEPSIPVAGAALSTNTAVASVPSGAVASTTTHNASHGSTHISSSFPSSSSHSYYGSATPAATINVASTSHYGHASTASLSSSTASTINTLTSKQEAYSNKGKRKWGLSAATGSTASANYYGPVSTKVEPESDSLTSRQKQPLTIASKKVKTGTKSIDSAGYYGPATMSWSKAKSASAGFNQSTGALADRAKRFAMTNGQQMNSLSLADDELDKYMGKSGVIGGKPELDEADYEQMKVKGTCRVLEKDYLRLTAPPRPELVRPLDILEQHLANLKRERQSGSSKRDYLWFCSQLKAVRQDCTVQHIRNAFTVDVYETHARIALEEGDLNEYNQCQTQLKELYRFLQGQGNKSQATANQCEFTAYRLLYYILLSCNAKYTGGSSDLFQLMDSLTPQERNDAAVIHALQVRVAMADVDYHAFFCLYNTAPNMGKLLMDRIVPSIRSLGLQRFFKAYRPLVESTFVLKELGFDVDSDEGVEYGRAWLQSCGCLLTEDGAIWNTKDTPDIHESTLEEKQSLI